MNLVEVLCATRDIRCSRRLSPELLNGLHNHRHKGYTGGSGTVLLDVPEEQVLTRRRREIQVQL